MPKFSWILFFSLLTPDQSFPNQKLVRAKNVLFEATKPLQSSDKVCQIIDQALKTKSISVLKSATKSLEKYADSFFELEHEAKISQLQNKINGELSASAARECNVIQEAKITISKILWHTKAEITRDQRLENAKNFLGQAGALTATGITSWGCWTPGETLGPLTSKFASSTLILKLSTTGLGLAAFMALGIKIHLNNVHQRSERSKHLASMIFSLQELCWQMSNLFCAHKNSLDQLSKLLNQAEENSKNLKSWLELLEDLDPEAKKTFTLDLENLIELERAQFLSAADDVFAQKLAIMALSKVMRELSKPTGCAKDISQLKSSFSSLEALKALDPIRVEGIAQNHNFLVTAYSQFSGQIIETLSAITALDSSWIYAAKNIIKTGQLFFDLDKPNYYSSTIDDLVKNARQEIRNFR